MELDRRAFLVGLGLSAASAAASTQEKSVGNLRAIQANASRHFQIVSGPPADRKSTNYPAYSDPLLPSPLLKLPLGAVQPEGWLKRQLDLMLDGITGRMPEFGAFVRPDNGWLHPDSEVRYWEEVPYWFRGFYPLAVLTQDPRCLKIAHQYIEAILASAQDDGYFGPRKLKSVQGKDGRVISDLGPHFLLIPALIHHAECTGDPRILSLLFHFFQFCRNLPEEAFIPISKALLRGWGGADFGDIRPFYQQERGGDAIPLILWVYDRKPEPWLLDLAHRVYHRLRPPWSEWLNHHGVMFSQRFAAPGYYSSVSRDTQHMQESEDWYTQTKIMWGQMPRGVMAMDERIRPRCVDPRQAFETCAMVECLRSFEQLGRLSGKTVWADRCEDMMLNHFTAALTQDMKAVAYLTASNMAQRDGGGGHLLRNEATGGNRSFIAYTPRNRCCGHNSGTGWPTYTENLWLATGDNGLAIWCYSACSVTAKAGPDAETVSFRTITNYPFSGEVTLECLAGSKAHFPLYLRIPGWARSTHVQMNRERQFTVNDAGSYIRIERAWHKGDVLKLDFEMQVSLTHWMRTGSVTVDRGPLSYSVAIQESWKTHPDLGYPQLYKATPDWPNWQAFPESPWNYALLTSDETVESDFTLVERNPSTTEPWSTAHAPLALRCRAKRVPAWGMQNKTVEELQPSPVATDAPAETIELIPLGCARLRIACLPVAGEGAGAWKWRSLPETVDLNEQPTDPFLSGTILTTYNDW